MQKSAKVLGATIFALFFLNIFIWQAAAGEARENLTVSFLNVGQGDSIFIESPTGRQVLIDGGPNREVLRKLARVIPWYDRSLDVVIATHPDADHISGLIDVLRRYRVSLILEPGVKGDTPQAESMLQSVANEDAQLLFARRGQVIDIGGGARIEILFPDRDVENLETNMASIVARLVYGETAFLLTGDSPKEVESYLVRLDGDELAADVLKAGHHGSRTSSSELFVGFVGAQFGVFSRGCGNTYGHPHDEVVQTFKKFGVQILDTCTNGTVTFVSDGKTVVRK